jgi:hypothetical protein
MFEVFFVLFRGKTVGYFLGFFCIFRAKKWGKFCIFLGDFCYDTFFNNTVKPCHKARGHASNNLEVAL